MCHLRIASPGCLPWRAGERTRQTRFALGTICAAFVLATAVSYAAPRQRFDLPPTGITPTTATLDTVLAAYRASKGSRSAGVLIEDWEFTEYGLSGSEHDVYSGEDYRESTKIGPFTYQHGRRAGQAWRQNENGLTILLSGVHKRDAVSAAAIVEAGDRSNDVKLLGEVVQPRPAYVIEVSPPGGRREWIFIDTSTSLPTRLEMAFPDRRVTAVLDDFRVTDGVTRAWHVHGSDTLSAKNDADWRVVKLAQPASLPESELQIPTNARTLVQFPPGVTKVELPAKFVDSDVIVRLNVNGRGLDFLLDSGASDIVFDRSVARSMGLTHYGEQTSATAGAYVQSQVKVPQIKVGQLVMNDIAAYSLPFTYSANPETKVVGLLGFDFIADAVIHVDYFHRRLEAIEPSAFRADQLTGARELPVILDDGVPMAPAAVGNAVGEHFLIDTGAEDIVLFSEFARAHPADVKDVGGGATLQRYFPQIFASGVGGELRIKPVQLKLFSFANTGFTNFIVYRVENAPSFEGEDADGLIGYAFLRYFDLYFDYGNGRLLLVPNELYKRQVKTAPPR